MEGSPNTNQIETLKSIVQLFILNADGFFPRMCTVNSGGPRTLHMFTDASDIGYGGVAYVTSHSGNASSHLLCAKSKLKGSTVRSTIPKLELCGILFGLEILEKLINILNPKFSFTSIHLWADAKVPLSWICSDIPHSLKYISSRTQKANYFDEEF